MKTIFSREYISLNLGLNNVKCPRGQRYLARVNPGVQTQNDNAYENYTFFLVHSVYRRI